MSDDEDMPKLPADTLALLKEFYADREKKNEMLNAENEDDLKTTNLFDEDWQLSQFWYDEETIESLVNVVKKVLKSNGTVGLISCPTLYIPIFKALNKEETVKLFEYDQRFSIYGTNFIYYDFNHPNTIPDDMNNFFDLVIADPPFLSEDCLSKTSETIKLMAKDKIVLCTGSIMGDTASRLLNLNACKFQPRHKNNLANEFSCFANFDLDECLL